VTGTEERARAAMRAIAGTVQGAPGLRLTDARDDAPRTRAWTRWPRWSVLAPVAAAVAIVVVAVTLVVARSSPGGRVAGPGSSAASSASAAAVPTSEPTYTTAAGVPEYYVAWMQAGTPYLIVGDAVGGQVRATLKAPDNVHLTGVYGTADADSTFIVTGVLIHGPDSLTMYYLLRIAPGSHDPARWIPLQVPGTPSPAGVALSPDGTEFAVALPGSPATLRVYSVATGALLRSWSTTAAGYIRAEKVAPGSWQFTGMTLRWSADGQQLAFAWDASAIRVLDANGPGGDLIARSRLLAAIGKTYFTEGSFTCVAAQGWQLTAGDKGILCAGSGDFQDLHACPSAPGSKCTYVPQTPIGFFRQFPLGQGGTESELLDSKSGCTSPQPVNGAYLGWANADDSVIIGSQVCDGQSRFGIFRGSHFAPLPALPESVPVPAGVLVGSVAW
jgi:hypothetical protein